MALARQSYRFLTLADSGAWCASQWDALHGPVAPKYRNPDNPNETWAGRGLKPRWLAAAIKGGKKLEDFAIVGTGATTAKPGRKPRKAKRTAKK
jgi:hypothetical protein